MSVVSGNGGKITIAAADFHIGKWTLNKNPRNVESGTSSQTLGTRYTAVKTDPSWTIELPFDSAGVAETAGLTEGAVIASLKFKVGAGSTFYTVANTTVDTIEPVCDANNDVVRYKITGKGGDVSGPS